MPKGAPPAFTDATRIAFYAGAMHAMTQVLSCKGDLPSLDRDSVLQITKELEAFAVDLKEIFEREQRGVS